jgi:hypothetical protein
MDFSIKSDGWERGSPEPLFFGLLPPMSGSGEPAPGVQVVHLPKNHALWRRRYLASFIRPI